MEPLERVKRYDSLPEHAKYEDDGCSIHPFCLSCPYVKCRYDVANGSATLRHDEMRAKVVELNKADLTIEQIATILDIRKRTVLRHLQRHRESQ